jgi:hypothetical protein
MHWQGRASADRHPGHRGVRGDRVRRESWDDIALYGRNKLGWLQSFLTLANGIPSHDTFRYRDGCAVCLPCPRQDQALPQHYLARVINLAIHWPAASAEAAQAFDVARVVLKKRIKSFCVKRIKSFCVAQPMQKLG